MTSTVTSNKLRQKAGAYYTHRNDRQDVLAVATFDSHGIPTEYNLVDENINLSWAQTVFQSMSLQMLLQISFGLQGFSRAVVQGNGNCVAIVKHECGYKAMLFRSEAEEIGTV